MSKAVGLGRETSTGVGVGDPISWTALLGIALAAANVVTAGVEVGLAATDLDEARQALQDAIEKEAAVRAYVIQIYETFARTLNAAVLLDQKGLNP